MPNVYHSDEVFEAYLAEHGSMDDAKDAIKQAAKDQAPTNDA